MSAHAGEPFAGWDERTLELASDLVTVGLADGPGDELRTRADAEDLEVFEHAAAALHLAALGELEAPPQALLERLRADAQAELGLTPTAAPRPTPALGAGPRADRAAPRPSLATNPTWGWLAAAVLLLAFVLRGTRAPAPSDPRLAREALVTSVPDTLRVTWAGTEDPLAGGVSGDVVWSSERQEGYMRFVGLAPNDPSEEQYQLWIFDPTRAEWEEKPVDGGVFDVARDGEVVVPIDPKLAVRQAALFAITLEEPGGVVVSQRERLVLTAAPKG